MLTKALLKSETEVTDVSTLMALELAYQVYHFFSNISLAFDSPSLIEFLIVLITPSCLGLERVSSLSSARSYVITNTNYCCQKNKRKVTYQFIDSSHSLCLDKKDIMYAELEACERLLKYASDEGDKKTVESEIAELKMALDLLT